MTLRERLPALGGLVLWTVPHLVVLGPVETAGYFLGLGVLLSSLLLVRAAWRRGWVIYYRVMRCRRRALRRIDVTK